MRKEKEITQEEFSQVLGVSCQSVSRWENGSCYPDIELVPTIASFFGVSTDKLMGVDEITEMENVEKYLERFQLSISRGEIDKCIAVAREGVGEYPNNYISNYDNWLYHVRKLNAKRIESSVNLVTTNILYFIGSRKTGTLCNQEAFVYYHNQFEKMLTNLYLYLNSGVLKLVCPEKYKDLLSYMATLGLFTTRRNDFIKYSRYIPEIVGVFSRNMKDLTSIVYTKGKGYEESKPYDNDESNDDQYTVPYELMYDHLIIYSVGFNESLIPSLLNGNFFSNDQMEIINHIENILLEINKIYPIREICDMMRINYDILSADLVHPKVKKRYSSKVVLQEGNLINK